jgi:hypothetical protein
MFECRDLGPVKEYLGMRVIHNYEAKTLVLDQFDYALKVVKRFGQYNAKPIKTPLPAGYKPKANLGLANSQQISYYQSIIGSLLYLALGTRPDIEHAVIMMSQFAANPSEEHIQRSLHIVKYVAGTLDSKITYHELNEDGFPEGFAAYADADWAGNIIDRRSVTGYIITLAGGAVSWKTARQKTIAHSSTEAEYMALSDCCKQVSWIQELLKELNQKINTMALYADNQGSIFLGSHPVQESRTKHMDIRYHYIRECVDLGKVELYYIPTQDQLADIFTKILPYPRFKILRNKLGLECKDSR